MDWLVWSLPFAAMVVGAMLYGAGVQSSVSWIRVVGGAMFAAGPVLLVAIVESLASHSN